MIFLWAAIGIALALGSELALGRVAPGATRYLAPMTLPMIAYALRTSQRSAMMVGCVSGLAEDFWIEPRLFGINGLVKTVLGWALGGLGARFDLNTFWGGFASGASVHLLDEVLQAAVRKLFGEAMVPPRAPALLIRGLAGGLLTAAILAILGKFGTQRRAARPKARKA